MRGLMGEAEPGLVEGRLLWIGIWLGCTGPEPSRSRKVVVLEFEVDGSDANEFAVPRGGLTAKGGDNKALVLAIPLLLDVLGLFLTFSCPLLEASAVGTPDLPRVAFARMEALFDLVPGGKIG